MKTILRTMVVFLMLLGFTACNDDEAVVETLEVTPANLDGTWKLVEWNGKALNEAVSEGNETPYLYITFNRKDRTYKMYDKLNSMYPSLKTGKFEIEKDPNLGYIISGNYDFGNGNWANSYYVENLTITGSMTWIMKGTPEDVQIFERCEKVPSEIEEEVREF